jgi:hypothetical protein
MRILYDQLQDKIVLAELMMDDMYYINDEDDSMEAYPKEFVFLYYIDLGDL